MNANIYSSKGEAEAKELITKLGLRFIYPTIYQERLVIADFKLVTDFLHKTEPYIDIIKRKGLEKALNNFYQNHTNETRE